MKRLWLCAGLALVLAAAAGAGEPRKAEPKTFLIPYTLGKTKHILVRAKINGQGPFNFILDTGAPALFVATKVSQKVGVEPDKDGWGTFERFEVEGGAVLAKVKGRIEDPFQLEGMNGLGLAGVELHGVVGYNVLARYRIEIDFTRDKMAWTELDFDPPPPQGLGGGKSGTPELNAVGGLMKGVGALLGKRPAPPTVARGFLGLQLADGEAKPAVKAVLAHGPAAKAGVKAGDVITHVEGEAVKSIADVLRLTGKVTAGKNVKLTVQRGGQVTEITVTAGEGL